MKVRRMRLHIWHNFETEVWSCAVEYFENLNSLHMFPQGSAVTCGKCTKRLFLNTKVEELLKPAFIVKVIKINMAQILAIIFNTTTKNIQLSRCYTLLNQLWTLSLSLSLYHIHTVEDTLSLKPGTYDEWRCINTSSTNCQSPTQHQIVAVASAIWCRTWDLQERRRRQPMRWCVRW